MKNQNDTKETTRHDYLEPYNCAILFAAYSSHPSGRASRYSLVNTVVMLRYCIPKLFSTYMAILSSNDNYSDGKG